MARVKKPKIVVTFSTTADAMAMEAAARDYGIPGRLIPVPREISAGCGLSWCAPADDRPSLLAALDHYGLAHEGVHDVTLWELS